jgi:hypothetical protein
MIFWDFSPSSVETTVGKQYPGVLVCVEEIEPGSTGTDGAWSRTVMHTFVFRPILY